VLWSKTYGSTSLEDGNSVRITQTSDSGFAVVGFTEGFGTAVRDVYALRLDPVGNIIWEKRIGGNLNDLGRSIEQTTDGGFVISGSWRSFSNGNQDGNVLKLDSNGNNQWHGSYGGVQPDHFTNAQQTPDGGYLAFGSFRSIGNFDNSMYLLRLDSSGTKIWDRMWGRITNNEGCLAFIQTADNELVTTGTYNPFGVTQDILLAKYDTAGSLLWGKAYGGTSLDRSAALVEADDGGYVIAAHTESFGSGPDNVLIFKTDQFGNVLWANVYGDTGSDHIDFWGNSLVKTSDGGYAFTGYSNSYGATSDEVVLVKINACGESSCSSTPVTLPATNALFSEFTANFNPVSGAVPVNTTTAVANFVVNDSLICDNCVLEAAIVVSDTLACTLDTIFFSNADTVAAGHTWLVNDSVFSNDTAAVLVPDVPGTYEVVLITEDSVCSSTDTVFVTVGALPVADLGNDTSICLGDTVVLGPVDTAFSPIWQDNSTDSIFLATVTGTYYVSLSGCVDTSDTVTITVDTLDLSGFTFGPDTQLCAGDTLVLGPVDTTFNPIWQDNSTDSVFVVTTSGTYYVTLTSACSQGTDTIQVTFDSLAPPVIDLGADTTLCAGDTLLLGPVSAAFNPVWQDNSTDSTFAATVTGQYYVTANSNCFSQSDTINLVFDTLDLSGFTFGPDTQLCAGDTLVIGPVDTTYNPIWQDNSTDSVFAATTSGMYYVTLTSACSQGSDTIQVTFDSLAPPVIDLGPDSTLCAGDTLLLGPVDAAFNPVWQDNSTNNTFEATVTGQYHVTNNSACFAESDTINLVFDTLDLSGFAFGPDTQLCAGTALVLGPVNPAYNPVWQDNSTDSTFQVTANGPYYVTLTTQCSLGSDTIVVTFDSTVVPVPNLGPDTAFCQGGQVVLGPVDTTFQPMWQDGSTDSTFTASATGTYHVTLSSNCSVTSDSIQVTVNPIPVVDLGPDTVICAGDLFMLDATTANATYLWSDGSTAPMLTVSSSGSYRVTVSSLGCTAADTVQVQVDTIATVDLGPDTVLCSGNSLVLDATTAGAQYLWNTGVTTPQLTINTAGTFGVTITIGNCQESDSVAITGEVTPQVDLVSDTFLCPGSIVFLDASVPNGSYVWSTGATTASLVTNAPGTYTVTVTRGTCAKADTVTVTARSAPVVNLGADTVLCEGQRLVLNAGTVNATYAWTTGSSAASITVFNTGTYGVVVNDGCAATDSIRVQVVPAPAVDLGPDPFLCPGTAVTLATGLAGDAHTWSNGSTANSLVVNLAGTYGVVVRNSVGCTGSDSVEVLPGILPDFSLGADTQLCEGERYYLNAEVPGASYQWFDGSVMTARFITQPGTYWVTVSTECGDRVDSIRLEPLFCDCAIWLPNAFTPNFDGNNELFRPVMECETDHYLFTIFDRWGRIVFESTSPDEGWDGTVGNAPAKPDVYAWRLSVRGPYVSTAQQRLQWGHVTLVR
ncbi:MAG: T9SS type B sorting domain-containing protein, partial [Bacteroidota bacterium]